MVPTVSVVIATYNRSNILGMVMETVRWQTLTDWELIVVGDACTDDTAEVVAGMNDPRIRFVNLEKNVGEQSGPNNVGCDLARGKYVAFLNHDDFWFPDHLSGAVEELERRGADLVFSLIDVVEPDGGRRLQGRSCVGEYRPWMEALASSWVFRRELLERVGPWRSYRKLYATPSQDWIFRAWRMGARVLSWERVGVVAIQSGSRKDSYKGRQEVEHREVFAKMRDDWEGFREGEMKLLAKDFERTSRRPVFRKRLARALWLYGAPVRQWLRGRFRKGREIERLRRIRGLPPLKRAE